MFFLDMCNYFFFFFVLINFHGKKKKLLKLSTKCINGITGQHTRNTRVTLSSRYLAGFIATMRDERSFTYVP